MMEAPRRGRRFYPSQPERGFLDVLKWQRTSRPTPWPRRVDNAPYPPPPQRIEAGDIACTWIGQSAFLIQTAGLNILTDPFFSDRAGPLGLFGPRRVRAPGVALAALPAIDAVLVSHNHYDHMDKPALRALAEAGTPRFVMPLANARLLRGVVPRGRISELDWGQSVALGAAAITAVPAAHWSRRTAFDTNRALWAGFVIETAHRKIYFAGDTGLGGGEPFRAVRQRFGAVDLSLLPVGAYEPRWFMAPQHMNPDDAVQAHVLLDSAVSLAMHHSTIQLTDEAIGEPAGALAAALAQRDVPPHAFKVADIGETIVIRKT